MSNPHDIIREAKRHIKNRNYHQSLEQLESISEPQIQHEVNYYRGLCCIKLDRPERAKKHFLRVIQGESDQLTYKAYRLLALSANDPISTLTWLANALELAKTLDLTQEVAATQSQLIQQIRTLKPQKDHADLVRLMDVGVALSSVLDLDKLLTLIVDTVLEITEAERGFLMLSISQLPNPELKFRIARNHKKETLEQDEFRVSQTIINKVVQSNRPLLLSHIENNAEFKSIASIKELHLKSVMCVPLHSASELVGVIYVDNSTHWNIFGSRELDLLSTLASQATVALENAHLYTDLEIERNFVESLFISTREIADSDDELSAIMTACRYILKVVSHHEAHFSLYLQQKDGVLVGYEWFPDEMEAEKIPAEDTPAIDSSGRVTFTDDILWVPIKSHHTDFGLLQIEGISPLQTSEKEKQFIRSMVDSLVLVLDRMRRSQIQSELEKKTNELEVELRSFALNTVKKNKLLFQIQKKLTTISKKPSAKSSLHDFLIWMKTHVNPQESWQTFEGYFIQVHGDFLQKLSKAYPDLTPQQLKICAYIKAGLSSKDIASLLYITPRTVDLHRYQIRQILQLSSEQNLSTFLLAFPDSDNQKK